MIHIDLQAKARPRTGFIEHYWFANPLVGLERTLFHRIVIPFEPFDSGLDYVAQPESTELVVEWAALGLDDPARLDGVVISTGETRHVEASIYVGSAHNWTVLERLRLSRDGEAFRVLCKCVVEFEREGVGKNEPFEFEAIATYRGEAAS